MEPYRSCFESEEKRIKREHEGFERRNKEFAERERLAMAALSGFGKPRRWGRTKTICEVVITLILLYAVDVLSQYLQIPTWVYLGILTICSIAGFIAWRLESYGKKERIAPIFFITLFFTLNSMSRYLELTAWTYFKILGTILLLGLLVAWLKHLRLSAKHETQKTL